jgi:uncharacterized membrane protein YqjE
MAKPPIEVSLSEAFRSLGDNLAKLLGEHVALAEVELKREGERLVGIAALIGVGLLWACVGYLVLMGALVALLAQGMNIALAATLVGLLNLAMGAGIVFVAVRRIKADTGQPSLLKAELQEDVRDARSLVAEAEHGESANSRLPLRSVTPRGDESSH